jgi:hypothetical protein
MGKNPKAATHDESATHTTERAAPAPEADEQSTTAAEQDAIPDSGDNTVWLQTGTGTWHVEVGSETYTRLMAEGATEVPPPADAQEGADDGTRDAGGDHRPSPSAG